MLTRIAYELFWVGRHCARAEHNARVLDGVFRVNLQGRPDDPAAVTLSWDALLAMAGAEPPAENGGAVSGSVIRALTLDQSSPASVVACVTRAREGCRRVRDVISTDMWEALNLLHLDLRGSDLAAALQAGPSSVYTLVKERCALFWGLADQTMLRDEARAFLDAGRHIEVADMVLRMLRVALPPAGDEGDGERSAVHDGQAFALLHAVGGFQAFRRASAAAPHVLPVTTFLLFQREYPHSVAASVEALHGALRAGDGDHRDSAPVLRLRRLMADLEFRRGPLAASQLDGLLAHVQRELELADDDIGTRYFAGADRGAHVVMA